MLLHSHLGLVLFGLGFALFAFSYFFFLFHSCISYSLFTAMCYLSQCLYFSSLSFPLSRVEASQITRL